MMLTVGYAIATLEEENIKIDDEIPAEVWYDYMKNVKCTGTTGDISFTDAKGDRIAAVEFLYFSPENGWTRSAKFSPDGSYEIINDVVWFSNTTEVPDLDIHSPFRYWSCHEKEEKIDKTGKTITRHTPDGSDIDDIDKILLRFIYRL
mmetsp:Transcript_7105/g.10860  ORF Transcript_7105/g.10860 Transcript_7105/m.10860 type:complete len:148 (+) Transcript_7105:622-1065(+)